MSKRHLAILSMLVLAAVGGSAWQALRTGRVSATIDDQPLHAGADRAEPALAGASPAAETRPNVVMISIDTLRADHLSCYGYTRPTTPHLDALAARGVRFANASAQASWTLPSHMSLMTSQYPHVHGVENDEQALAEEATTLPEVLAAHGYETAAFISWVYLGAQYGFAQGFDEYTELLPPEHLVDSETGAAYRAEEVTDHAIRWLNKPRTEPFFLFLHYFDPHISYEPPPPYDRLFDPAYEGAARGTFAWLKQYIKGLHHEPAQIDARDLAHITALYDGEIRYTDEHLGRLFDALERTVGLDECLLVVTSDHGEELFEHGSMEGHQWTLYEETVHVPLIFSLPGAPDPGRIVQTPVELIDVAATILNLLDIARPWSFQGRAHSALLAGDAPPDDVAFAFSEIDRFNRKQSIRDARYKLIHTDDIGNNRRGVPVKPGYELFDLERDPHEQVNIFHEEQLIALRLLKELEQRKCSAPTRGPGPAPQAVQVSQSDMQRLRSLGYVGGSTATKRD